MKNYQGHFLCDGCGKTFTRAEWDDRHIGHEPSCRWKADPTNAGYCDCDLNYHSWCCPICINEEPDEIPTGDVMA